MASSWQPPKSFRERPVAVLGGGVLGRRIAACWCAGGWNVHIRDPSEPQRKSAVEFVNANISDFTVLTQREPGKATAFAELPEAVKDAWLVFEAVPEKLSIKIATFHDLEQYAPADCILASNSSSFKSSQMLEKVQPATAKRILNTHYMMPPKTLVVELMTDGQTEEALISWLTDRHKEAGLDPIVALKESTGFVFNRVWAAIKRETLKVIQEGVSTPEAIDAVFKTMYGAKQGPCRMMDGVGLDTVDLIEQNYVNQRGLDDSHLKWLEKNFVQDGKLGNKTPDKGGLYPPVPPGKGVKLVFLDLGTAEPYDEKLSADEMQQQGRIMTFDVSGGAAVAQQIKAHEAMPDGIDICEGRFFWTDMGSPPKNDGCVYSCKIDGSDIQRIVPCGATHTPKQLICVASQKKIYWCDREGGRVMRADLDGGNIEILVQTGDFREEKLPQTSWCVGVAVSEKLGKLFWTLKGPSKGRAGRIMSAGLDTPKDPSNRSDIQVMLDDLPEPIDLELDDEDGVLYWTDRGELPLGNTLNKKTLVGEQPAAEKKLGRQILTQGFGEAIGLKLDKMNDCIYVADLGGHIWRCDPNRLAFKHKVFENPTAAFSGLTILRY